MKKEFVNTLMEKYSFFYRDPEKKVYKKYPTQVIAEEVGDEWYGVICRLCEQHIRSPQRKKTKRKKVTE